MNTTRSLVSVLAIVFVAAGCNVDFVPVETESDAGMQPAADAGTTPPPAICGGANLQNDVRNCGTCGNGCTSNQTCVAGTCTNAPVADAGTTPPPPACGGANLQSDPANCGVCGRSCGATQTCNAGTCTSPAPADAGTPAPTTDDWRVIYRAPSGATVTNIQAMEVWDGSARECTLSRLDPAQMGAPLTSNERCPNMRFARGATLRFNARFTLAATSSSAPMPLENWSCHIARAGGPMLPFGTVEAYRNGVRVELRMVDNERQGCNWAPVSN